MIRGAIVSHVVPDDTTMSRLNLSRDRRREISLVNGSHPTAHVAVCDWDSIKTGPLIEQAPFYGRRILLLIMHAASRMMPSLRSIGRHSRVHAHAWLLRARSRDLHLPRRGLIGRQSPSTSLLICRLGNSDIVVRHFLHLRDESLDEGNRVTGWRVRLKFSFNSAIGGFFFKINDECRISERTVLLF